MAKKKHEEAAKPETVSKYLTITLADGTKQQLRFRGKTEKEAKAKRDKAKWEYEQGLLVVNGNSTFAKWAEEYLETYRKPRQAESTYKDTEALLSRVFTDTIGYLRLADVKTAHLQSCLNELEGKSKSYINQSMVLIKGIFDKAITNGLINRNPALAVEPPKGSIKRRRALTEEEKKAFFAVAEEHEKGLLFSVMLGCGLRPGEARALAWSNVSIDKGTITITSAMERRKKTTKPPKTDAGYRTIPMPKWLIAKMKQEKKKAGDSLSFIFHDDTGQPMTEQRVKRAWKSFLRLMDLEGEAITKRNKVTHHSTVIGWNELTPYYLRHTYATGLAEAGVDIKTAQYLLGHSDIKMTAEIYTHVTPKMLDNARDKINALHDSQTDKTTKGRRYTLIRQLK